MINSKIKITILFLIIIIIHANENLLAQQNGEFYFKGNVNQEYSNNFFRFPDSSKNNDFRLLSSLIIGYNWKDDSSGFTMDAAYENRYLRYYKLIKYIRMDHNFLINGSIKIVDNNVLFLNNESRVRNYNDLKQYNYFRNIFSLYDQVKLASKFYLILGYKNWVKNYHNSALFKDYLSHRVFSKLNYNISENNFIGLKFEYQFHKGNLYPLINLINTNNDLSGTRYFFEIYFSKLWGRTLLTDITYKFENDQSNNPSNQGENNFQGDENFEELLIDDADFDYFKNQFNVSFLIKLSDKISLFSFNVLRFKDFNNWLVNPDESLRKDVLLFNSIILKYKIANRYRINFYYNFENNNSNLPSATYNSNKIGLGLQFYF